MLFVDGDGDVDGADLAVFAADFGRTDCSCVLDIEILKTFDASGLGSLHGLAFDAPGANPTGLTYDGSYLCPSPKGPKGERRHTTKAWSGTGKSGRLFLF